MGTTLSNLHIYDVEPERVKPLLTGGYTVLGISKGWTSVFSPAFREKGADTLAKKVSKQTGAPVLSFYYFDDDLLALTLFQAGKWSAGYCMQASGAPYLYRCGRFISELGFDPAREGDLRKIFRCSEAGQMVELLEEFFGVALYVDLNFFEEGTDNFIRQRGDEAYRIYSQQMKKADRIKNCTKMTLTQEIDAKLFSFNYPYSLAFRDGCNVYDHRNIKRFKLRGDTLEPLPDGEINAKRKLPPSVYRVDAVLDNGNMICRTKQDNPPHIICLNPSGDIVWDLAIDVDHIWINPVLYDGHIYFGSRGEKIENDGELFKLDLAGNTVARKAIPYIHNHSELLFEGGFIYYLGDFYGDRTIDHVFLKMDESFGFVGQAELPKGTSIYSDAVLDRKVQRAYYYGHDNVIAAIDLNTLDYTITTLDYDIRLMAADENGLIYGGLGLSTLCILDRDMKLRSRHRVKGAIYDICRTNTGMHVLTATGDMSMWGHPEQCVVRVYRIDPA